jgi:hypothetical protein
VHRLVGGALGTAATRGRPCNILLIAAPSATPFACIIASSIALTSTVSHQRAVPPSPVFRYLYPPFGGGLVKASASSSSSPDTSFSSDAAAPMPEPRITKLQLKASLASSMLVFSNGSVPKEVQQDLWRYLTEDGEGAGAAEGDVEVPTDRDGTK